MLSSLGVTLGHDTGGSHMGGTQPHPRCSQPYDEVGGVSAPFPIWGDPPQLINTPQVGSGEGQSSGQALSVCPSVRPLPVRDGAGQELLGEFGGVPGVSSSPSQPWLLPLWGC